MSQQFAIIVFGIIGTLVLINLFNPYLEIELDITPNRNEPEKVDPMWLYLLVYFPVMVIAGFMLMPLVYEEVDPIFKLVVIFISGINATLYLEVVIPLLEFAISNASIVFSHFIPVLLAFLVASVFTIIPFVLHVYVFLTFLTKKTLKKGKIDPSKKYYME